MPSETSPDGRTGIDLGMVAYFLFPLSAVFIGPLEAALGLAVYWVFDPEREEPT
jgi:hypothetical protein